MDSNVYYLPKDVFYILASYLLTAYYISSARSIFSGRRIGITILNYIIEVPASNVIANLNTASIRLYLSPGLTANLSIIFHYARFILLGLPAFYILIRIGYVSAHQIVISGSFAAEMETTFRLSHGALYACIYFTFAMLDLILAMYVTYIVNVVRQGGSNEHANT